MPTCGISFLSERIQLSLNPTDRPTTKGTGRCSSEIQKETAGNLRRDRLRSRVRRRAVPVYTSCRFCYSSVMEAAAGLIKLRPNSDSDVKEWRETMRARRDEALQTLRDEGVVIESWFTVEIAGEPYLLWFLRADSIARVWEVAETSDHAIDVYHFDKMSKMAEAHIQAVSILDLSIDP